MRIFLAAGQSLRRRQTLAPVIPGIEKQISASIKRTGADRCYRGGQNAPPTHKFRLFISGQKRRVTQAVKRELKRFISADTAVRGRRPASWCNTSLPCQRTVRVKLCPDFSGARFPFRRA